MTDPERKVIRPPIATFRAFIPWAVAACFAVLATWVTARLFTAEAALDVLRDETRIATTALKSQRLSAERDRLLAGSHVSDLTTQLDARGAKLGEAERQLTALRGQLGERERAVAALEQRIDALAGASAEIGRQLGEAYQQVAQLARELKARGEVAELKITALASLLGNTPEAKAIAVWDPLKQEGMLQVDSCPRSPPTRIISSGSSIRSIPIRLMAEYSRWMRAPAQLACNSTLASLSAPSTPSRSPANAKAAYPRPRVPSCC
jgi:hypothetical protein